MPEREPRAPDGADQTVPSVARIYDYLLGGKDNYAADRQAAAAFTELVPEVPRIARANRQFLARCVRFLAGAGVRQFVDLGAGLPTAPNVHQVARAIVPDARVVYVDHDPVVLAYGNALFATDDRITVVQADVRDPGTVLANPAVTRLIDFSQPVAVLLLAVLHFIGEDEEPGRIVAAYTSRLAPGSYLAISAGSSGGGTDPATDEGVRELYRAANTPIVGRSAEQLRAYFAGCELVEPGVVPLAQWHPDTLAEARTTRFHMLAGVGRKL